MTVLCAKNFCQGKMKMSKISNWNRIGSSKTYNVTLVGTEDQWLAKKKELTDRHQTILSEGSGPSAFGSQKKYWARVKMPEREEAK